MKSKTKPEVGHYCGSNYREWSEQGLMDYGDFAESVEFCNQTFDDSGSGMESGEWWYGDDDNLVIYSGSYANDHSPGASHYTSADVYATEDEYHAACEERAEQPEYLDDGEDEEYDLEPEDGDLITQDHRTFYQYGRAVLVVRNDEDCGTTVRAFMDAQNHWPNVWFVSDHGNAHLMDI